MGIEIKCSSCDKPVTPGEAEEPTESGVVKCDDCWWKEEVVNKGPQPMRVRASRDWDLDR